MSALSVALKTHGLILLLLDLLSTTRTTDESSLVMWFGPCCLWAAPVEQRVVLRLRHDPAFLEDLAGEGYGAPETHRIVLDFRQPEPPLIALPSSSAPSGNALPFLTWRGKSASVCVCVVTAEVSWALLHPFFVAAPTV